MLRTLMRIIQHSDYGLDKEYDTFKFTYNLISATFPEVFADSLVLLEGGGHECHTL